MEILNTLSQYANLINLALLITIIGWLFTLTQQYKEAIKARLESELASFKAKLDSKDIEIKSLTERLSLMSDQLKFQEQNSSHQLATTQADLERTEKWYEREKAELAKKLANVFSEEGITKEGLIMDTATITAEIKSTIINVLKEVSELNGKFKESETQEIKNPEIYLDLAKGFSLSEQWFEAAKNYDKYISYNPKDWEAHLLRGLAYAKADMGEETYFAALRSINEAITLSPKNIKNNIQARLFFYRGKILINLDRLNEAEYDFLLAQKYATDIKDLHFLGLIKANLAIIKRKKDEGAS